MSDSFFSKQSTVPILTKNNNSNTPCPEKIGPYNIKGLFNKGGMSLLYLGSKDNSTKPLIVKVLPPKYAKDKEMVTRFLKEAEIINISNHPNIIKLYGQGTWEKGLYIATEFVQGISLRQFLQSKAFSEKKALEIILQVAYALCHLHSHKIIHRDLKPENILITESGEIKVIDFGIAQLKSDSESETKKRAKIIGTPVYMSPEQKKDPSNVSFQTDIYSLGIIIYELVLGRLSHGSIDLSLLPKDLKKIVSKTLEIDLKKRYQNIVDFVTDIGEYIKKLNDKKNKEQSIRDDIISEFKKINKTLLSKNLNSNKEIEVTITESKGTLPSGIYIESFHLSSYRQFIIVAETVKNEIKSITELSILKGLIHSTIHHIYNDKANIDSIVPLISSLNQIFLKYKNSILYSFSAFLFCLDTNKLIYNSIGNHIIFNIIDETKKINTLTTTPSFLGDKKKIPLDNACDWNKKDKLFLLSSETSKTIKIKNHTPLKNNISANIIFPVKLINKKIIEQIEAKTNKNESAKLKDLKNSKIVISIERTDQS